MFKSRFLRYQLSGIISITAFIGFCAVALYVYEKLNPSYAATHITVSGYDGAARRGMFVWWLFLVLLFTFLNIGILIIRRIKNYRA